MSNMQKRDRPHSYLLQVSILTLAAFLMSTGFSGQAEARPALTCSEAPLVQVMKADPQDQALICRAASRALSFLSSYDLAAKRDITVDVVEELISSEGYSAYGSYDSRSDRITLMSLASILTSSEKPMMYQEPFDEVHYLGAAAHEIAHAVVQHNLQAKPISPGPQEYLAHATQLAVLPAERRERIIAGQQVEPWLPGDTISDIYMAIKPTSFAVKSYLHLTSLDKPEPFVTILLRSNWFYVYVPE